MDVSLLIRLLEYFNLSWSGYRKVRKGVKKHTARHMQALNIGCMNDYLELIEKDENVRKICFWYLSVSISQFYRDRNLWDGLGKKILPALLCTFSNAPKFKVWSCGCASGEEAYSFLMLWESLKNGHYQMPDLEMVAADMNPEYLKMAEEPPPLDEFHLIFARHNLLFYYNDPGKTVAFLKITNALKIGGALIIGSHEKIPDNIFCLRRCQRLPCLYFKEERQQDNENDAKSIIL